jgi:hypothetical protein
LGAAAIRNGDERDDDMPTAVRVITELACMSVADTCTNTTVE